MCVNKTARQAILIRQIVLTICQTFKPFVDLHELLMRAIVGVANLNQLEISTDEFILIYVID